MQLSLQQSLVYQLACILGKRFPDLSRALLVLIVRKC